MRAFFGLFSYLSLFLGVLIVMGMTVLFYKGNLAGIPDSRITAMSTLASAWVITAIGIRYFSEKKSA